MLAGAGGIFGRSGKAELFPPKNINKKEKKGTGWREELWAVV